MDDPIGTYVDRFGNTVVLTQYQWGGHILIEHPEVEPPAPELPSSLA